MKIVKVYTSESGVSSIPKLLREIFNGFLEGRFLAKQLFLRDLKASVRQSFLGFFWHFIPAVATAVIWIILNSQKVISVSDLPMSYPAFAITGSIIWTLFTEGVNKPLAKFVQAKGIMVKLNFPREAIVLSVFYDLLFTMLLKMLVLLPALLLMGYFPTIEWLFAILGIFSMYFISVSIGLILIPIGMLYTDIAKGLGLFLQMLMYLSPVVFPYQTKGIMGTIHHLNPASPFIEFIRSSFGGYEFNLGMEMFVWSLFSLILFVFGLVLLRLSLPAILERSGS